MAAVVALIAAIGLSACGRKGPLEPPPQAGVTAAAPEGLVATAPKPAPPAKPDKPFFLDPLLD